MLLLKVTPRLLPFDAPVWHLHLLPRYALPFVRLRRFKLKQCRHLIPRQGLWLPSMGYCFSARRTIRTAVGKLLMFYGHHCDSFLVPALLFVISVVESCRTCRAELGFTHRQVSDFSDSPNLRAFRFKGCEVVEAD